MEPEDLDLPTTLSILAATRFNPAILGLAPNPVTRLKMQRSLILLLGDLISERNRLAEAGRNARALIDQCEFYEPAKRIWERQLYDLYQAADACSSLAPLAKLISKFISACAEQKSNWEARHPNKTSWPDECNLIVARVISHQLISMSLSLDPSMKSPWHKEQIERIRRKPRAPKPPVLRAACNGNFGRPRMRPPEDFADSNSKN